MYFVESLVNICCGCYAISIEELFDAISVIICLRGNDTLLDLILSHEKNSDI